MQSPPPPRLYTYVENSSLEPVLILMDIVAKGQCLAIPSDTVHGFEQALSHVIQSAQLSVPNEGFWRNYVRLERVYNAVEVHYTYQHVYVVSIWFLNRIFVSISQTLCLCVLITSTIHAIMKLNSNALSKKKKKKGDAKSEDASNGVCIFVSSVFCYSTNYLINVLVIIVILGGTVRYLDPMYDVEYPQDGDALRRT